MQCLFLYFLYILFAGESAKHEQWPGSRYHPAQQTHTDGAANTRIYHVRALSKFAFAVPPFPLAAPGSSFDVADGLTLSIGHKPVNLL